MLPFCWLLQMHTRTHKLFEFLKITYNNNKNHESKNQIKNGQFFQMIFSPKKLKNNRTTDCFYRNTRKQDA